VTVYAPDLLLDREGVRRAQAVEIERGRIVSVRPAASASAAIGLAGRALAPGFVNAHSHAFQRDVRGATERPDGAEDNFWSWREQMYVAAQKLDPATIGDAARRCYAQMRRAGYTSVGEFHYIHHHADGTEYDEPNLLAQAVCEAAESQGMRICLLLAAYERGGAGLAPSQWQRRFCDPDVRTFLARVDALVSWAERRPLVTIGLAPHSVRAVSAQWLEAIAAFARERALPLHVHACEQRREIDECVLEHGMRPIELLARVGVLGEKTTVIHATHADDHEIDLLAESGTTVCLCPTTEGNLGDGWPSTEKFVRAGIPIAIGSDSNVRLDPLEELREIEICARRSAGRRNVVGAAAGLPTAAALLRAGWDGGAGALGLAPPRIAAGSRADLIEIDLGNDALRGVADEDIAAALVFCSDSSAVARTWVLGTPYPK